MSDVQSLWIWISSVTIWLKCLTFGAIANARSFSKKVSYHSCMVAERGYCSNGGGSGRSNKSTTSGRSTSGVKQRAGPGDMDQP